MINRAAYLWLSSPTDRHQRSSTRYAPCNTHYHCILCYTACPQLALKHQTSIISYDDTKYYDKIYSITTIHDQGYARIAVMPHEHHDVPNHIRLYCFVNSLFRIITKKILKPHIAGSLGRKTSCNRWIFLKRASNEEMFPWHEVIMEFVHEYECVLIQLREHK